MRILHEDQYTFLTMSRSLPKKKKNVSEKNYRENQDTFCVQ
jgi:hypothetical protein